MYLKHQRKEQRKMIKLTKASLNSNIALTLTEKVTLDPVYFLFEFISDISNMKYYVILSDTSSYTERYNEFEMIEGSNDPTNGRVLLGDEGFYTYNVYEQSNAANLDPTGLTIVETGKMKLLGDNQTFTKHTIDTDFIVHDPTT